MMAKAKSTGASSDRMVLGDDNDVQRGKPLGLLHLCPKYLTLFVFMRVIIGVSAHVAHLDKLLRGEAHLARPAL